MNVWMERYFCYFSVRLGVIVVSVLTAFQLVVPAIVISSVGIEIFNPLIALHENDADYSKIEIVKKVIRWVKNDTTNFMLILNLYLFLHAAVCVLTIFAAVKLLKWWLLPFIVLEFIRVLYCFTWHISLMTMIKEVINLGALIACTLLGGFILLFLSYNWAASVALFQIFGLIRSDRYRALYGDNPFINRQTSTADIDHNIPYYGQRTMENIRVLIAPKPSDINDQKGWMAFSNQQRSKQQLRPIIAVIPIKERSVIEGFERKKNSSNIVENHKQNKTDDSYYADDYKNWQWAELVRPGYASNRSNWY